MEGSHGTCGGNRRRFLKAAVAAGPALAAAGPALAATAGVPTIVLGKTGQEVTRLGMGSSWSVAPGFVQALLAAGVKYIDTAEGYERGKSEKTIGAVLERTGKRKDVFLVTKTHAPKTTDNATGFFSGKLNSSLERLQTDYVDSYFMHGVEGREIPLLKSPEFKAAFEALKSSGKIKYCGLSCHDPMLVQVLEAVAECGWIDHVMIQYNYRTMTNDNIKAALDKLSAAKVGIVAMKTQGGAGSFKEQSKASYSPNFQTFQDKGFNQHQAAIKSVFADERIHAVVSEMTNRDMLRENMAAAVEPLTPKQSRLLEEHRQRTAHLYCHGCGNLCETAAKGVPVATVLRYLRYYEVYGKRAEARALYQALPPEARDLASANLPAAEAACPHGLPVAQLVQIADRRMG